MTSIPKGAWPVVEVIRRDVSRPKTLPTLDQSGSLRWQKLILHHRFEPEEKIGFCPMGLHKKAMCPTPSHVGFRVAGLTRREVDSFIDWWDSRKNAKAAMKVLYEDELV